MYSARAFYWILWAGNPANINAAEIDGAGKEHENADGEADAHVGQAEVRAMVADAGVRKQSGDADEGGEEEGAERGGEDEECGLEDAEVAHGSAEEPGAFVVVGRGVVVHQNVPCG